MNVAVVVLASVAMMEVALGHLCMLDPPQRGSMTGINKPGAADCFLTLAPCGGRQKGSRVASIKRGESYTVTVQKNLNHFNAKAPGKFDFTIIRGTQRVQLGSFPDTKAPSLSVYSFNLTMPQHVGGPVILQAKYETNNPKAPPVFFQCADIMLYR